MSDNIDTIKIILEANKEAGGDPELLALKLGVINKVLGA